MAHPNNIICLEAEWLYTNVPDKKDKFDLKTEAMLELVSAFHDIEVIHRNILNKESLNHYLKMLSPHRQGMAKYGIVYIASHGQSHTIRLEDAHIDLEELADMANNAYGFFEKRIVHFSCCKTLSNPDAVEHFKQETNARLVTGYSKSVDAMKSVIADAALFNHLVTLKNVGTVINRERSAFWKTYGSLLDELGFQAY